MAAATFDDNKGKSASKNYEVMFIINFISFELNGIMMKLIIIIPFVVVTFEVAGCPRGIASCLLTCLIVNLSECLSFHMPVASCVGVGGDFSDGGV